MQDFTKGEVASESKVPEVTLGFWIIKIAATTLGATVGDFLDKPLDHGGLALSRPLASVVIAAFMLVCLLLIPQRAGQHPGDDHAVERA